MFDVQRRPLAKPPLQVESHMAGNAWAPVIIVEYGTYCRPREFSIYPTIYEIQEAYPDQVAFVYRHYPLTTSYPSAFLAAEAAEAAAAQGRFWKMHGYLVGHPRAYTCADLIQAAQVLGLDAGAMASDLQYHTHAELVREHLRCGVRDGIRQLPALFINGVLYEGATTAEALRPAVLEALRDIS
jgi:protein-disulfide isomerase